MTTMVGVVGVFGIKGGTMSSNGEDLVMLFKTVQIEMDLSEYGGNKKAVRTDGLLAKHQN